MGTAARKSEHEKKLTLWRSEGSPALKHVSFLLGLLLRRTDGLFCSPFSCPARPLFVQQTPRVVFFAQSRYADQGSRGKRERAGDSRGAAARGAALLLPHLPASAPAIVADPGKLAPWLAESGRREWRATWLQLSVGGHAMPCRTVAQDHVSALALTRPSQLSPDVFFDGRGGGLFFGAITRSPACAVSTEGSQLQGRGYKGGRRTWSGASPSARW